MASYTYKILILVDDKFLWNFMRNFWETRLLSQKNSVAFDCFGSGVHRVLYRCTKPITAMEDKNEKYVSPFLDHIQQTNKVDKKSNL